MSNKVIYWLTSYVRGSVRECTSRPAFPPLCVCATVRLCHDTCWGPGAMYDRRAVRRTSSKECRAHACLSQANYKPFT